MSTPLDRIPYEEASNPARWTEFSRACGMLGRHVSTIYRWIDKGKLRAARTTIPPAPRHHGSRRDAMPPPFMSHIVVLRTIDVVRLMYSHPANREHVKTCIRKDKKVEIVARKSSQNPDLNRLNNRGSSEPASPHQRPMPCFRVTRR
ncbi:MAG TPA: hypothetical protein VEJ63_17900 [Planctomycetota bacterium]|nr:hypothetical protein [Planctomycetota bacterium]